MPRSWCQVLRCSIPQQLMSRDPKKKQRESSNVGPCWAPKISNHSKIGSFMMCISAFRNLGPKLSWPVLMQVPSKNVMALGIEVPLQFPRLSLSCTGTDNRRIVDWFRLPVADLWGSWGCSHPDSDPKKHKKMETHRTMNLLVQETS